MYNFLLTIHLLSATIWTGGHLFLVLGLLPKVLKNNDYQALLDFERLYEKVGMPALVIQVLSGIYLAYTLLPDLSKWFDFQNHLSLHISIKLILLFFTVVLAVIANTIIIPRIATKKYLYIMAVMASMVTLMAIFFVITGLSFRLAIF